MSGLIFQTLLAAGLTAYPAFGDSALVTRPIDAKPRVEASVDHGPIIELVVGCGRGTAIVSYSKLERLYCGPDQKCDGDFAKVVARACGS